MGFESGDGEDPERVDKMKNEDSSRENRSTPAMQSEPGQVRKGVNILVHSNSAMIDSSAKTRREARIGENEGATPLVNVEDSEMSQFTPLLSPKATYTTQFWHRSYWTTRRMMRTIFWTLMSAAFFVAIPYGIYIAATTDTELNNAALYLGSIFTGLSVPMALYGIFMHLERFSKPDEQRHIIRVLWMVPIYSLNAWGALILGSDGVCRPGDTIYLDTVRECYEGYAIYNFVAYIEAFLIREYKQDPSKILQSRPQQKHIFPFCFLPKWRMGESFYMHCKYGTLQYIVVQTLLTSLKLVLMVFGGGPNGIYGDGKLFSFQKANPYFVSILNVSQIWAIYCLVLLYIAVKEELKPIKPFGKFACIKLVVFFTFWQEISLQLAVQLDWIPSNPRSKCYSEGKVVASVASDFLITVEMLAFAIAHAMVFSSNPYRGDYMPKRTIFENLQEIFTTSDIRAQVYQMSSRALEWRTAPRL